MIETMKANLTRPNGGAPGPVHIRDPRVGIEPVAVTVTAGPSGPKVTPGKDADKGGDCPMCKRPY